MRNMTKLFPSVCVLFVRSIHSIRVEQIHRLQFVQNGNGPLDSEIVLCVCVCSNGHEIPSARAHRHRWLNYSHVNYLVYRFYYRARTHYTLTKGHRKEEISGEGGGGMVVGLGQQKLCEWKLLVAFCTYSSVATMCTSCIWIPIARWMVSSGSGCMPQIEQYREQREQFGNGNVCKTAT